jgi:hypothetical protein
MVRSAPDWSVKTDGHIEDRGLFPGCILLESEGGIPKSFVAPLLKSSISLLRSIPVDGDMTFDPKLQSKQRLGI